MLENERRREGKKVTTQPVPRNELQMDQIFNWKFKTTGGFYNAAVERFYLRIPGKIETERENLNKFGCI